jgi:hypothetical protein
MTKVLALERPAYGLYVEALAPSYVAAELGDAFFEAQARRAAKGTSTKRRPAQRIRWVLAG